MEWLIVTKVFGSLIGKADTDEQKQNWEEFGVVASRP